MIFVASSSKVMIYEGCAPSDMSSSNIVSGISRSLLPLALVLLLDVWLNLQVLCLLQY